MMTSAFILVNVLLRRPDMCSSELLYHLDEPLLKVHIFIVQ